MDKNISFSLMAEHRNLMHYHLTYDEFIDFRCLIQLGGKKTIGNYRLEVKDGFLTHYKKSVDQPAYSIELDGALEILDRAEEEARNAIE